MVRLPRPASFHHKRDVVARVAPAQAAQRVTAVGSLDLDDVGPEVGEVPGAARASHHRRGVDDLQISERRCARIGLGAHPNTLKPSGNEERPPSARIITSGSATCAMIAVVNAIASGRTVGGRSSASVRSSVWTVSSTIRVGR